MAHRDDTERRFHEEWLGMVQPDGLVVSIPVLMEAQCFQRNPPALQQRLKQLLDADEERLLEPRLLLTDILELPDGRFDRGEALPKDLAHYHERESVVPSAAFRRAPRPKPETPDDLIPDTTSPQSRAGEPYELLVMELPDGVDPDTPDGAAWSYEPALKLERLIRDTRVEIGLILAPRFVRLIYAPHGQAAGSATFKLADMANPGGRAILDALVMLLRLRRLDDPEWPLRRLLAESRERQANVTTELAKQVFQALQLLLDGVQDATEEDGRAALDAALARGEAHVYGGLLTVMLRMVFVLYAEDRGLLPMNEPLYADHLSLLRLFAQLQEDHASYPDTMNRRHGAWPRILALFRTLYDGARHGSLKIPARRGELFDPDRFPFLEGRARASDPPAPPHISDGVIHGVLERLLILDRERVSYKTLDVEQIGSVYEKLMGYHVWGRDDEAVCLKGEGAWVTGAEVLEVAPAQRESFLVDERGLPKNDAKKVSAALKAAKRAPEVLDALDAVKKSGTTRNRAGRLVLQPGPERRRTSSHYTPRSLSEPVVRRALEPLLGAMGGAPTAEQLLALKICDPAMGSGAFLVEACRFLADQVVAAWGRDPNCKEPPDPHERLMKARRLVAQRCLYGVDKNAMAVTLGRLSMWLITMAADEPFTFVDHALKHGDSLVGLSLDQIKAFHWSPKAQTELFAADIEKAVADALRHRQAILDKATCETEKCALEKEDLHATAERQLENVRLIADLCVGAWFAADTDKARESERKRRLELVHRWLTSGGLPPDDLLAMQRTLRTGDKAVPAFHWMIEFPEVFHKLRPDPLDADRVDHAAWMDSFIGNPPFMGGSAISGVFGPGYLDWLTSRHTEAHGNADIVAYFFRLTFHLLGQHGTLGLVATKTISQGDTRSSGLRPLVRDNGVIYDAVPMMRWPGEGDAAVSIATVHIAKGRLVSVHGLHATLAGQRTLAINSHLRAAPERPDPVPLSDNRGLSFLGTKIYGEGFRLTPAERSELVRRSTRNAERIRRYVGGEDLNTHPEQLGTGFVIDLDGLSLPEADTYPDLIAIVRAKVLPERMKLADNPDGRKRKTYWWHFGRSSRSLAEALGSLPRCLAWSQVSKHLVFSWQDTDQVFSHTAYVAAISDDARFAVLQSRIHERWARLLSSTMKTDLRYTSSDCLENFPFPEADRLPSLAAVGAYLYAKRKEVMKAGNHGLTALYNQLKDPGVTVDAIVALRRLHEDMDRAVLAAYHWSDINVPPYEEARAADAKRAFAAFEDAVIDRLFALNGERAAAKGARLRVAPTPNRGADNSSRRSRELDAPTPEVAGGVPPITWTRVGSPKKAARSLRDPDITRRVPQVGTAPCGNPIYAEEFKEAEHEVPAELLSGAIPFIVRADGNSMNRAGIESGDLVLAEYNLDPRNRDIVVALRGNGVTIKRFVAENGTRILMPESTSPHGPITEDFSVQAVVLAVGRMLTKKRTE